MPVEAITLSLMTHKEIPWKDTKDDCIIDDNIIISYYSGLPFAKNFPLNSVKTFYPLLTNSSYAFFADMGKKEMNKLFPYESYDYFRTLREDNQFEDILNKIFDTE
ncbi:MAG: hypothetical protein U5N56_00145 [Candidatus Marinimicrobia bacterium]|nr:hypothetical protein [Candidatus Neomarinimicrobiota bacterium]